MPKSRIDLPRWLYLTHRMDLNRTEHQVLSVLALAFWPGGVRLEVATVTASWVHRMGAGAAPVHASRALRKLVDYRMLDQVSPPHTYALEDDPFRWAWNGCHRIEEWSCLTDVEAAWTNHAALMQRTSALLRVLKVDHTQHPADPVLRPWLDAMIELEKHVSPEHLTGALLEAAADPEVILPPTPVGFALNLHALILRWRRRDRASEEHSW